jgi:hypothetical protein
MLHNTFRSLRLRKQQTRSRKGQVRPASRPALEVLESRLVPTFTFTPVTSSYSTVAYAAHPSTGSSSILDYAVDTQSANTGSSAAVYSVTAWITLTYSYAGTSATLYYTTMSTSGTVSGPYTVRTDGYDTYGRLITTLHVGGSAENKEVDVAVAKDGSFAIAYTLVSIDYAHPTDTSGDYSAAQEHVFKSTSSGTKSPCAITQL